MCHNPQVHSAQPPLLALNRDPYPMTSVVGKFEAFFGVGSQLLFIFVTDTMPLKQLFCGFRPDAVLSCKNLMGDRFSLNLLQFSLYILLVQRHFYTFQWKLLTPCRVCEGQAGLVTIYVRIC